MSFTNRGRINSTLRKFLDNEAAGGLLLMGVAAFAIVVANSPLAPTYFTTLKAYVGPLSVQHWVNDGLMALFFLLVGLEIKREMLDGQLATWSRRILPGVAAAGGMAAPALVYLFFNASDPAAARGWAIPSATDIAFALGVLSLLGPRVPASLKVFLAALAIIDDLGAVLIIAAFYTSTISGADLLAAAGILTILVMLNYRGVNNLTPYVALGAVLWFFVLRSGVHATVAGVLLALTIPIQRTPASPEADPAISPLHRLEHLLSKPVAFLIVPIFGFANAGLSLSGVSFASMADPVTVGVLLGLVIGKLVGVFGAVALVVKLGWADLPASATWTQTLGVSLLCGIGFTMSLFIGLLAFDDVSVQDRAKMGILVGSLVAGSFGFLTLLFAKREA